MMGRILGRHFRALLAAVAAVSVGPVVVPAPAAPTVQHEAQRDQHAKPERSALSSMVTSRRLGPLGLPFDRPGGNIPPWIDSRGRLLRQVVR